MLERLQKILSARGIASRRKAEEYIEQGLVKVNGKVMKVGDKADPEVDSIEVDGKVLESRREMLYYLLYKPVGVETTNTERAKGQVPSAKEPLSSRSSKTVRDLLPAELRGKVFTVGRLDKDSEGLLLLTNDGVLAYRLTHPKFDHEKEYVVTTEKTMPESSLEKMRRGMMIKGEKTKPCTVTKLGDKSFRIALTEGKNRQIRRMCQKVDNPVSSLKRVRIMTLSDDGMRSGQLRPLTAPEKAALLAAIGV
jgi:pseudouridine synthase